MPPIITVHRPPQSIPYFQNVIMLHGTNNYISIYTHNKSTAFPFTYFHETLKSLPALRADLHRNSLMNWLTDVYSVDRNFQLRDKIMQEFSCTNFHETHNHWTHTYIYIYIYTYILYIVNMCLYFLPNNIKGAENTEKFQFVS
jgi:hypothetical protein